MSIPSKLAPDFVEAKGKLQHTLSKLTNAEQAAIDYLGVEFILAQETKQFGRGDQSFARPATRSVFLKKREVECFETVWEECFHLLAAIDLLEGARREALGEESFYYQQYHSGNKTLTDLWEEVVVDCARYKRLNAQIPEEMQQKFGLLWEHTGIVEQEMSFIAEMPAGTEKNTAIQSLFELRNSASWSHLKR